MAATAINPLNDQRYREINQALGMILQVRDLMNKAEQCGVDVSADRAYFDAQEELFQQWKTQFFPTKP